jgi:tripartite-type tricarboxylate transporter receptor subunit TctC
MKLFIALLLALAAQAGLAAYPERPITLIVAYPPGGGTDLIARALAPYVEKNLGGAKIVIVNRAGAGGEVGFAALAAAAADGYTIGFVNTPPLLTIPIERPAQFTWQRFDYIGNIIDDPCNFSVHSDTNVKNLAELAAYAKANPGAVTVGTTGIGSDDHLAMLKFERAAGVKMRHIPFKGSAEVRAAILGKQIMVAAINIGEAL